MMRHAAALLALFKDGVIGGRRRVAYLTLTLLVTVAAWLTLAAMASPFVPQVSRGQSGIMIANGSQNSTPLPLSYARRLAATPGARDVTWTTFQLLNCSGSQPVMVSLNAIAGPGTDAKLASEQQVDAATLARWNKDPQGILVDAQTMAKCGWHVGQGVSPPLMTDSSKHLDVHIIGTLDSKHGGLAFAHYDYINRTGSMGPKDTVFFLRARAANPRDDDVLAARIEAEFAQDFPTVNATTNANTQGALARFGKVQQLLAFVMGAILLCAASVMVSVLAHDAAQRRPKFAVLQVLGFRRRTLFAAFALEVVLVLVLGAALGTVAGHELARLPLFGHTLVMSTGFAVPQWAYYWIPAWLAALLAVSLVWPLVMLARVKPSDYRAL